MTHSHVISQNITGTQYINAIFESDLDAAIAYVGIANQVMRPEGVIAAEKAYNALIHKGGMGCGTNKMLILLTKCEGGCKSPSWN